MRDFRRIDPILARIRQIWYHNPDWRLMQLLTNVIGYSGDHFNVEDTYLEHSLKARIRDWGVQMPLPPETEEDDDGQEA